MTVRERKDWRCMVILGKCSPVRRQEKYVGLLQFNPSTARNKSDISHLGRGEWRTNHTNGNISHNSQLYSRISDMLYRDRLMRVFLVSSFLHFHVQQEKINGPSCVYSHGKKHVLLFY